MCSLNHCNHSLLLMNWYLLNPRRGEQDFTESLSGLLQLLHTWSSCYKWSGHWLNASVQERRDLEWQKGIKNQRLDKRSYEVLTLNSVSIQKTSFVTEQLQEVVKHLAKCWLPYTSDDTLIPIHSRKIPQSISSSEVPFSLFVAISFRESRSNESQFPGRIPSRTGRKVRQPSYLKDYVKWHCCHANKVHELHL